MIQKAKRMPLSADIISQHIYEMGQDTKCQLPDGVKRAKLSLELYESEDSRFSSVACICQVNLRKTYSSE